MESQCIRASTTRRIGANPEINIGGFPPSAKNRHPMGEHSPKNQNQVVAIRPTKMSPERTQMI
jgi:hypothetical protein